MQRNRNKMQARMTMMTRKLRTKKENQVICPDTTTIVEDLEECAVARDCILVPETDRISLDETFGFECNLDLNGTSVILNNSCGIEQKTDSAVALHRVEELHPQQFHEERQEVTSSKARSTGEHFIDNGNDEGRQRERDDVEVLKDQCPLAHGGSHLTHHSASSRVEPTEQEWTPQSVFEHLLRLEKLYKNGALTEEQYIGSRKRLWTKISRPGHQCPPTFKPDKSQTASKEVELHLNRLHQLCRAGAITEEQYYRARSRMINYGDINERVRAECK